MGNITSIESQFFDDINGTCIVVREYLKSVFGSNGERMDENKSDVGSSQDSNESEDRETSWIPEVDPLDGMCCPITQEIMREPVIIETGHTFERKAIDAWFSQNNTCPITRKTLRSKTYIKVYSLKRTISSWKELQLQNEHEKANKLLDTSKPNELM